MWFLLSVALFALTAASVAREATPETKEHLRGIHDSLVRESDADKQAYGPLASWCEKYLKEKTQLLHTLEKPMSPVPATFIDRNRALVSGMQDLCGNNTASYSARQASRQAELASVSDAQASFATDILSFVAVSRRLRRGHFGIPLLKGAAAVDALRAHAVRSSKEIGNLRSHAAVAVTQSLAGQNSTVEIANDDRIKAELRDAHQAQHDVLHAILVAADHGQQLMWGECQDGLRDSGQLTVSEPTKAILQKAMSSSSELAYSAQDYDELSIKQVGNVITLLGSDSKALP